MAAKVAFGQKVDHERGKINVTQLRKNSRSRSRKNLAENAHGQETDIKMLQMQY